MNSNNIFANLPFHILNILVFYLNNLDVFCFSLICRRFWFHKDKFLHFNNILLFKSYYNSRYLKYNGFKSFYKIFEKSSVEPNGILFLDHHPDDDYFTAILKNGLITFNIEGTTTTYKSKNIKTIKQNCYSEFNETIANYNITSLDIQSRLTLEDASQFLLNNSKIKELRIGILDNVIKVGNCLPNSLESLEFYTFSFTIEPGALPESLKELILHRFDSQIFTAGVLPSNLATLKLENHTYSGLIDYDVLPITLTNVTCPQHWLPQLKRLPHLESLKLYNPYQGVDFENDLPVSLTKLDLSCFGDRFYPIGGKLHKSIVYLDISNLYYPETVEFSMNTHYRTIVIGGYSLPSTLQSLKVDELCININQLRNTLRADTLPNNIKKLMLFGAYYNINHKMIKRGSIPSTVETLNIEHFYSTFSTSIIPKSVHTLIVPNHFICCTNITSLPKTIKNIQFTSKDPRFSDRKNFNSSICTMRRVSNYYHFIMVGGTSRLVGGFIDYYSFYSHYIKLSPQTTIQIIIILFAILLVYLIETFIF